jgi:peptide/nickel transport system permease protein
MPQDFFEIRFGSMLAQGTVEPADVDRVRALFGMDDNSFWGLWRGYFGWLGNVFRGNLGMSLIHRKPVADVITEYMGISFLIAFIATVFQFLIAIPLGIKAATNQYGKLDYSTTVFVMLGISLPTFFLGALLIRFFSVQLGWFPINGMASAHMPVDAGGFVRFFDRAWHLVLPITGLVILSIGGLMRYTRTNTLEVLNSDFIRTARAKGLGEKQVIGKHAFRNTLIPLVTIFAGLLPGLFGGAMITEEIFAIEGIGRVALNATRSGDVPLVMGYTMFLAVLTVVGMLLADIMYAVVDPRVKFAG